MGISRYNPKTTLTSHYQMIVRPLLFLVLLFSFIGCRKDITPKLPEYHQKVVIEGAIETGEAAVVLLSYSVPYFGEFDYAHPEMALVKGATVVVSDGFL